MMQKRLLSLLLITVAVLGIGLILSQRQQPVSSDGRAESGPLVPALSSALNDISSVRIRKAKDELVAELSRTESGWVVANRHNYPADISKVRAYLIKLSEAKLREAKTSKPENYARLGVEDTSAEGATGLSVELSGLKEPVRLIVGVASGGGSPGTFVRRASEAESWLVSGDIIPDKEGQNWLAREVLDVPSADIHSVAVIAPDKSVLKIDKPDPSAFNYSVHNLPKGRQLSSESAANAIAGVLSSVTLEDVLPAAEANADAASTWQATFVGYDGLVVDLKLWDRDSKSWATFAARLDEERLDAWVAAEKAKADAARAEAEAAASAAKPADAAKPAEGEQPADATAAATPPTPAIPEPFDADKAKADKRAALDKRIAELNAKTSPWVYAIPTWKTANVKKKVEDLLALKG
ncbi:MAG: DUF4340 domain-containing protein [Rhodanobacteraceae bacterium]|nr:DUF4340 domain-containing protein [Rhodanobacteraceae bacterium]